MNGTLVTFRPAGPSIRAGAARREDRWADRLVANRRRVTVATIGVLLASVAIHGALVATALLDRSAPKPQAPTEIAVEVVPEMPKPPEAPAAQAPQPPPPPTRQAAAPPPPPPPAPPKQETPSQQDTMKAMQEELAKLKAEQQALEAERAAMTRWPATPAGLGPMPESFQAVALPSQAGDDGEPVGYAAIVFSQLAKAKEIGGKMGLPGTAAVHFVIDAKGALVGVNLVHSSGIKQLDVEALDIVRRAAPFPSPPAGAQRDFSANVSFVAGDAP